MRVVTNNRCVEEQIKSDKVENAVMGGIKIGEVGQVGKRQHVKSIVMDGIKIGKVGTSENSKTDEERRCQNEEKFCKSVIQTSQDAIVRDTRYWQRLEKKKKYVTCIDDVTRQRIAVAQSS